MKIFLNALYLIIGLASIIFSGWFFVYAGLFRSVLTLFVFLSFILGIGYILYAFNVLRSNVFSNISIIIYAIFAILIIFLLSACNFTRSCRGESSLGWFLIFMYAEIILTPLASIFLGISFFKKDK